MIFSQQTCVVCSDTETKTAFSHMMEYLQKLRFNLLLPLGKFLFTWRWKTNEISLLLMVCTSYGRCVWVSDQAWVTLPIYWWRENTSTSALASRVNPLQYPIQLPLMRQALSPPYTPLSHILCIRDLLWEKLQKRKQTHLGKGQTVQAFL